MGRGRVSGHAMNAAAKRISGRELHPTPFDEQHLMAMHVGGYAGRKGRAGGGGGGGGASSPGGVATSGKTAGSDPPAGR